jgi:putative PIN family toxin of toxin-antitoxin system
VRVVLDPNVLISASIAPRGITAALLNAWAQERFEMIASPDLLTELQDVLSRERFRRWLAQEEADAFVAKVRLGATLVDDPTPRSTPATPDSDDEYLIALARAAGADYLVSGDRHLTPLAAPGARVSRLRSRARRARPVRVRSRSAP